MSNLARKKLHLQIHSFFKRIFCLHTQPFYNLPDSFTTDEIRQVY